MNHSKHVLATAAVACALAGLSVDCSAYTLKTPSLLGGLTASVNQSAAQTLSRVEDQADKTLTGAWVDLDYSKNDVDVYQAKRTTLYVGLQSSDEFSVIGGSFMYGTGDIKGDGVAKQDWTTMGANVYGQLRGGHKHLTMAALYEKHEGKLGGKSKPDVFGASLKLGYDSLWYGMTITTYAGYRLLWVNGDGADDTMVHQFPLGVKVAGYAEAGKWRFVPVFDLAYVPQLGDKTVTLTKLRTADGEYKLDSTIRGSYQINYSAGVDATYRYWTVGLHYKGATGAEDLKSHSIIGKVSVKF